MPVKFAGKITLVIGILTRCDVENLINVNYYIYRKIL